MRVRNGREFLSIPGPTTVPDRVLAAMHRPAVDIYDGELLDVTRNCLDGLSTVLGTTGNAYIYAANGHGAWEAALTNCLSAGDRILVLESGFFAVTWGGMAEVLGLEVEILPGRPRRAVDAGALEQRLRNDTSNSIKAVLTVQIDTASGVVNDIPAIRRAMNMADHDALLMVDTIALAGFHALRDGRLGRGCRGGRITKRADDSPGSGVQRRRQQGQGTPRDRRSCHPLLGLGIPRRTRTLHEVLRHGARTSPLRPGRILEDALRGGTCERHRAASPARRNREDSRFPVVPWRCSRVQHHRARRAREFRHHRAHERHRSGASHRLLPRCLRCHHRHRHRARTLRQRPSVSPTWDTSMPLWCSAHSR